MTSLLGCLAGIANTPPLPARPAHSPFCLGSGPSILPPAQIHPWGHLNSVLPLTSCIRKLRRSSWLHFQRASRIWSLLTPLCCHHGLGHHCFLPALLWSPPPWSLASALAPDRWFSTQTVCKSGYVPPLLKTLL